MLKYIFALLVRKTVRARHHHPIADEPSTQTSNITHSENITAQKKLIILVIIIINFTCHSPSRHRHDSAFSAKVLPPNPNPNPPFLFFFYPRRNEVCHHHICERGCYFLYQVFIFLFRMWGAPSLFNHGLIDKLIPVMI